MIVPPGENFFGVDYYGSALMGASASQFKDMVGDILIAEEFGGKLWHVRWNSISFDKTLLAQVVSSGSTPRSVRRRWRRSAVLVEVALSGTATDDGRPPGSTLTTTWSVLSGPARRLVRRQPRARRPPPPSSSPAPTSSADRDRRHADHDRRRDDHHQGITPHNDPPVAERRP